MTNQLNSKIASVMREIGAIQNTGKHHGGFGFLSAAQVKMRVQVQFAAHELTLSCVEQNVRLLGDRLLLCDTTIEVSDGETSVFARGTGGGNILTNNGGLQLEQVTSAQSRALKSALQQLLLIASDDDEHVVVALQSQHTATLDPAEAEERQRRKEAGARRAKIAETLVRFAPRTSDPAAIRELAQSLPAEISDDLADIYRAAIVACSEGDDTLLLREAQSAGVTTAAPATKKAPAAKKAPAPEPEPEPESDALDFDDEPGAAPADDDVDTVIHWAKEELADAPPIIVSTLCSQAERRCAKNPTGVVAATRAVVSAYQLGELQEFPRDSKALIAVYKSALEES